MKTKHKVSLLSLGFGVLVFAGFAGSISGSLAWWAYSTRASIGYHGTSVASSEQLQIGIKTDINMYSYGMTQTIVNENESYYFCAAGTGLQAETIAYFLKKQGVYAIDELIPVTSGSYSEGDTLDLKNSLVSGIAFNENDADQAKYVRIPLAFRIMRYDENNVLKPVVGENIWLSETSVEASSQYDGDVYKAIRMYTSGREVTGKTYDQQGKITDLTTIPAKRLINPSDKKQGMGETAVAGLLDLSGNGYYDTYEDDVTGKLCTMIYGEPGPNAVGINQYVKQENADSGLVNFNDVQFISPDDIEASTFVAKYAKDTYHPNELSDIDVKKQNYDTLYSVKPTDSNSGILSAGKPVCSTALESGIADLDLIIWLEGWDHNVIDKENRHSFNLGLQFMISRL